MHSDIMIKFIMSFNDMITFKIIFRNFLQVKPISNEDPRQNEDPAWEKREVNTSQVIPESTKFKDRTKIQTKNWIPNQDKDHTWGIASYNVGRSILRDS